MEFLPKPPPEAVPTKVEGIGQKIKAKIHEFTPQGRIETYKAKYQDLLDRTDGFEQYLLTQKIDADAQKHAWGTFTRDMLVISAGVGTVAYGGKRMWDAKGNVGEAGKAIGRDIGSITGLPGKALSALENRALGAVDSASKTAVHAAAEQAKDEIPGVVQTALSDSSRVLLETQANHIVESVSGEIQRQQVDIVDRSRKLIEVYVRTGGNFATDVLHSLTRRREFGQK